MTFLVSDGFIVQMSLTSINSIEFLELGRFKNILPTKLMQR